MSERAPSRVPALVALALSIAALAWAGVLTVLFFAHTGRRTIVAEKVTLVDSANQVGGFVDADGVHYMRDNDNLFGLAFDSTGAPGLVLFSPAGGATLHTRDTVRFYLSERSGASAELAPRSE